MIEKEPLAVTWAREFTNYVLSMQFTLETDLKPLVPLLSSTDLSRKPPRILRFSMRLMKHNQQLVYIQGNKQVIEDTFSCAPERKPLPTDDDLVKDVEKALFVRLSLAYLQTLKDFTRSRRHKMQIQSVTRSRSTALNFGPSTCQIHPFCALVGRTKII